MRRPALIALATALLIAGCGGTDREGEVTVSVIGDGPARLRDPLSGTIRPADAALMGAVAQGLVRFDEGGQLVPGLAIRWAISDDGLYYTFRLDQQRTNAGRVSAQLRRAVRRHDDADPGNAVDAISEIIAVTPEVIEIRLSEPRPELLALLAGPSFALLRGERGTGPLLIDGRPGRTVVLKPEPVEPIGDDEEVKDRAHHRIYLHGDRAALAVARFAEGKASLVIGGDFTNIAYTGIANIAQRNLLVDPANGLFGLRVGRPSRPMMAAEIRQALSMAVDRDALGAALGATGWRSAQAILPPGLTDLAVPSRPFWAQAFANVRGADQRALDARVATASRIVAQWRERQWDGDPLRLSIALPDGPGSAMLFATLRRQWHAIGVGLERVGARDQADLRLIDDVAPTDQADWYLAHFLCRQGAPCSEEADRAFDIARSTTDPALRAKKLAEVEQRLTALAPFIPLGQPFRWSLAAPDLVGFKPNSRAIHPLAPLIGNLGAR